MSHVEGLIPKEFGAHAVEVLGARALLADLEAARAPWAIVVRSLRPSDSNPDVSNIMVVQTSGTRPLVTGWLDVMQLAHPKNMVVAEDVHEGKPGEKSANPESNSSLMLRLLMQIPSAIYWGKNGQEPDFQARFLS